MALKCRGESLMDGVYTKIDSRQIMATSKMVRNKLDIEISIFI